MPTPTTANALTSTTEDPRSLWPNCARSAWPVLDNLHARQLLHRDGRVEVHDVQGFATNLVTAALVVGASRFGLPVSTTHISCGALFGLGMVTRQARWKVMASIVLAWVVTLPVATLVSALAASVVR